MKKRTPIKYKRNKLEISGDPSDVKIPIWTDLILSHLLWIVPMIILLCIVPKASLIPAVFHWFRKYISLLTFFVVVEEWVQLLFSG